MTNNLSQVISVINAKIKNNRCLFLVPVPLVNHTVAKQNNKGVTNIFAPNTNKFNATNGVKISSGDVLNWSSDNYETRSGFKICLMVSAESFDTAHPLRCTAHSTCGLTAGGVTDFRYKNILGT